MSAEFQNGLRDPYGIGIPDANDDTYGTTTKHPQAAWVAGGQMPTGGDGGLPVSPPQQTSGPYAQLPGPLGQAANSPPPPATPDQTVAEWAPPSAQGNQPAPSQPTRPELKTPSTLDYILQGLSQALRGRASGALFGALAAPGQRKQDINAAQISDYDARQAQGMASERQAFAMRPRPPTAEEQETADIARISADPDVMESRGRERAGPLGRAEYRVGLAKATEDVKQPGRESLLKSRLDAADERIDRRNAEKPPPKDTAADFEIQNEREWRKANPGKFHLDYVREKAKAGRAEPKPEKPAKPALSDTETMRKHVLARGRPSELKTFDEGVNKRAVEKANADLKVSKSSDSPSAKLLFGATQSGQAPTQSGLRDFHVNPQTGERIGFDGTKWVPAPPQ